MTSPLPLLSICIATKDRGYYCTKVIETLINLDDDRIEILISDNSKDNIIEIFLEGINSSKIKYVYDRSEMSSIDNFNRVITLATGEYITMIGDDDFILPEAVNIAEWAKKNDIDSVSSTNLINYIWPNKNLVNGLLSIPFYRGGNKAIDTADHLSNLIKNGFLNYQSYNLPRVYHGIVKRSKIEYIKSKKGYYFGGLSPDIYSTVALSLLIKRHYLVDYPFTVAGSCPSSSTSAATSGGHSGRLHDAPHLKNRGKYEWEKLIPKYYSVETIWAETALKALIDFERTDLLLDFNMYRLYIYGIILNRKYILYLSLKETMKMYKVLDINIYRYSYNIVIEFFKNIIKIILSSMIALKIFQELN